MKSVKFFITAIIAVFLTAGANAQTHDRSTMTAGKNISRTENFKVWGKCDMCKDRIETTLKLAGISSAVWDKDTKQVTVTFDPSKTSVDAMQKKLALAGHDTEKYRATDEAYSKLPSCCHYDRTR